MKLENGSVIFIKLHWTEVEMTKIAQGKHGKCFGRYYDTSSPSCLKTEVTINPMLRKMVPMQSF